MALNKLKFNSINVTPAASEAITFNSSANGLETASAGGNLIKIASTTASSSSSISFTSGLTSTHKEYIFFFNNMHPATDGGILQFNLSIDGGSNYNVAKTSTTFRSYHNEAGNSTALEYTTGDDLAQGTGAQRIIPPIGSDNDQSASGFLHLFEPSSTTFVKHFISSSTFAQASDYTETCFAAGYGNTTSAINAIQFSMDSGNIDAGTITMYGVL